MIDDNLDDFRIKLLSKQLAKQREIARKKNFGFGFLFGYLEAIKEFSINPSMHPDENWEMPEIPNPDEFYEDLFDEIHKKMKERGEL